MLDLCVYLYVIGFVDCWVAMYGRRPRVGGGHGGKRRRRVGREEEGRSGCVRLCRCCVGVTSL